MKRTKTLSATLGGAFSDNETARDAYPRIGYVFVTLPTGETLQLFYNDETRLFVADVNARNGRSGIEFVRLTVPAAG